MTMKYVIWAGIHVSTYWVVVQTTHFQKHSCVIEGSILILLFEMCIVYVLKPVGVPNTVSGELSS